MQKLIVADDHQVVCKGITYALAHYDKAKVLAEVHSFAALKERLLEASYDLLIMDLQLGDKNGIHAVREISDSHPELKILVLSALPDDPYAIQSIHAGAKGYLNKSTMLNDLLYAIDTLLQGKIYLNHTYRDSLPLGTPLEKTNNHTLATLSQREFQVYRMLASGMTNKEIAFKLDLNPKTVSTYRMRILEKLGLSNSMQLMQHALHSLANRV